MQATDIEVLEFLKALRLHDLGCQVVSTGVLYCQPQNLGGNQALRPGDDLVHVSVVIGVVLLAVLGHFSHRGYVVIPADGRIDAVDALDDVGTGKLDQR